MKKIKSNEFRCMSCNKIEKETKGIWLQTNRVIDLKYWNQCHDQRASKTLVCACCNKKLTK